ncbi:hypothetical protein GA0111570_11115 [Raineyella antarctica]|uniref:Sel1 repeat-containing protein n=1 Tax=Raineyella antarctica TaxID=1577474 RepID=A0A1G6HK03_9ACTN|nr:hypothetical protein [Raineyella antarctica]SDB94493.1 hypothetical protein GA0111570_11115 [Raineyella antarctica]
MTEVEASSGGAVSLAEERAAYTAAAEAGDTDAMYNPGVLLADVLDPPDLAQARHWYTTAAGPIDAIESLRNLPLVLVSAYDLMFRGGYDLMCRSVPTSWPLARPLCG